MNSFNLCNKRVNLKDKSKKKSLIESSIALNYMNDCSLHSLTKVVHIKLNFNIGYKNSQIRKHSFSDLKSTLRNP